MSPRADPQAVFSPLVAGAMVVGGLLCFVAFVVVLAFARGPGQRDGGGHALSQSAIGFAGMVTLLCDGGADVSVSRSGRLDVRGGPGLRVFTPPPGTRAPEVLLDSDDTQPVLLVLPKWNVEALADHEGWVRQKGLLAPEKVAGVLPTGLHDVVVRRSAKTGVPKLTSVAGFDLLVRTSEIQSLQTIQAPGLNPLLRDEAGNAVLASDGEGLFVLADPDLIDNLGLGDATTADSGALLLRHLADGAPIAFDLSLNGLVRDPLRAVFEPPLLGATLCAAAAALLLAMGAAVRFGPVQVTGRAIEPGKLALAANTAALIARARRERMLAAPYAALSQRLASRAVGLRQSLTGFETTQALKAMAARRGSHGKGLDALLADAEAVRDRSGLQRVAMQLYVWRKELVGADRRG